MGTSLEAKTRILTKFNDYVRDAINPNLPQGYRMNGAKTAEFCQERNGWVIKAGDVQSPAGQILPLHCIQTIQQGLDSFFFSNCDVARIDKPRQTYELEISKDNTYPSILSQQDTA